MIPAEMNTEPESLVKFIEQLDETFPEYKFKATPAIYDPDTFEPIRGIMARTHGGEVRKLRLVLRGGMKSDIAWSMFFSPAPTTEATISEIERDVVRAYIQEIREELYPTGKKGDYLVKGEEGEMRTIDQKIFNKTHEVVDD